MEIGMILSLAFGAIGVLGVVYMYWGHPSSHSRKRINSLPKFKDAVLKTMACARTEYKQLTISPGLFQATAQSNWYKAYRDALTIIPTQENCKAELVFVRQDFLTNSVFPRWAPNDNEKQLDFGKELAAVLRLANDSITTREVEPLHEDHPEQPVPFLIAVADKEKMAVLCAFQFNDDIDHSAYKGFWTDDPHCVETVNSILDAYVKAMESKVAVPAIP